MREVKREITEKDEHREHREKMEGHRGEQENMDGEAKKYWLKQKQRPPPLLI